MPSPDEIWAGLTAEQKKSLIQVASAFAPAASQPAPPPAKAPSANPAPKPSPSPKKKIAKSKLSQKPAPRAARSAASNSPAPRKDGPKPAEAEPAKSPKLGKSPGKKAAAVDEKLLKWVGTKVKKGFNGTIYSGKVTRVHPGVNTEPGWEFYRIVYSDGDSEDILIDELRAICIDGPAQ